jgi:hypothetical protein
MEHRRWLPCRRGPDVKIHNGVAHLSSAYFQAPGARARVEGRYKLDNSQVDLHGNLWTDASLSDNTTGIKGMLLEPLDPLFRRKHAGAMMGVSMTGDIHSPTIGTALGERKAPWGKKQQENSKIEIGSQRPLKKRNYLPNQDLGLCIDVRRALRREPISPGPSRLVGSGCRNFQLDFGSGFRAAPQLQGLDASLCAQYRPDKADWTLERSLGNREESSQCYMPFPRSSAHGMYAHAGGRHSILGRCIGHGVEHEHNRANVSALWP